MHDTTADSQAAIVVRLFRDVIDTDDWTEPVVDPESPGLNPEHLAKVIAERLTGFDYTPSGAVRLEAESEAAQVTLWVITWGPMSQGSERRETQYTIDLGGAE